VEASGAAFFRPAGQAKQVDAPLAAAYVPEPQVEQPEGLPGRLRYCPATHEMQLVDPEVGWYEPTAHGEHFEAPVAAE